MSKDNKRYSILKKPSNVSSPTGTYSKADRRISFSTKNSIKEFMAGDDKATIWGTSYEESASSKDAISISDTQPIISEPRIIIPTKIPHKNIGMVLRNRKVKPVHNTKKIQAVEEEKENVDLRVLPVTRFYSNDINNSDMDLSVEDLSVGIEIKDSENKKVKENFDSVPITSSELSCSENTLKSEISSPNVDHNSTFNRTPAANWVLNSSLDITLSEDEKNRFLFKDKKNNDKSHSPLKDNNGWENSQGVTKKGIYPKISSPLKEYNATENPQGAIRKVMDQNSSSKKEEIKTSLQDDSNEEFFDCMDIPAEILSDTEKNIIKTVYWSETIQDKTGLTEKSRIEKKSVKDKIRHTILVDEEMEIPDNAELMGKSMIGPKTDKKNSRHTMLLGDEMEIQDKTDFTKKISIEQNADKKKSRHTMLLDEEMEIQDKTGFTEKSRIATKCIKKNSRPTMLLNDEMEIQDKTELTEKSRIGSKPEKAKIRHTIFVDDEMEIQDKFELTEKNYMNSKSDKKPSRHTTDDEEMEIENKTELAEKNMITKKFDKNKFSLTMLVDDEMEMSFGNKKEIPLINNKDVLDSRQNIKTGLKYIAETSNLDLTLKDQNLVSVENYLRNAESYMKLEENKMPSMTNKDKNQTITLLDISEIQNNISHKNHMDVKRKQTIFFQNNESLEILMDPTLERINQDSINLSTKSFQNVSSMELEDSNILKSTPSESFESSSHKTLKNKNIADADQSAKRNLSNQQESIIYNKEETASPHVLNNTSLSESFMILDSSYHSNEKKNLLNDEKSFIKPINIFGEFSKTQNLEINKFAIKERHAISQKTIGLNIPDKSQSFRRQMTNTNDIDNSFKSETEVGCIIKRQTTMFKNNGIELENLSQSRIQNLSIIRNESQPKLNTIFSQKNDDVIDGNTWTRKNSSTTVLEINDLDITDIDQDLDIKNKWKTNPSNNRQTIMFQENNELDTTNIINNECLPPRIQSIESDPKRNTIFNQKSNEMDVINSSQEHPQHCVISETRDLQKIRETIMFQANNDLDTTNISENSRITSGSKNRKESEPKRRTIFNQENNDMDVTNISIEHPQHPVTVDSKRINQNRQTIMFQANNELDTTNITDNEYLPSRIQSVSMFRGELEPKRHTIYSQKNNDMDVTNISKEHSQHDVIAETRDLQKNRQTFMFQANNDLDTTNISVNDHLHSRITSGSKNSKESEPNRHTIFNQENNDMDVTNISIEHPQHPVTVDSKRINKNRQTIMFQENNELDSTNITDNEYLSSRIQSVFMFRGELEPKRHTIFSQKNNDMDETNIPQEQPPHNNRDSIEVHENRQTIMFQENNELDTTNIINNECLHPRIQSIESNPKHDTIFNQKSNKMDVINSSQEHPQHCIISETRDLQKNRQTIMFQANNDLDTTNISNNDHLHPRITSGSKNRKESEPKRHTIFNQKNNDMDVTNISIEHPQHPVTVDSKRINKNRQTIMFQENNELDSTNITDNEYLSSRIQSVSMSRGELEPKRQTIYSHKNNDMDVTNISKEHPHHAVIAETRGLQKNRQTIMFQANNELDTINISDNDNLHSCITSSFKNRKESEPNHHTIFNQENNDMDVTNISIEHPQHPITVDTKRINQNRQTIMFQENNELDTTNITDNEYLPSSIQSVSMFRSELEPKRHTIFSQKNNYMDETNIAQEHPPHGNPDSRDIQKNRQTIMFQTNNELDTTNISGNDYLHSRITSGSKNRIESEPKRHTTFNQENNDMDVTNISIENPQHPVTVDSKRINKNRQTIMFQKNNELDSTNITDNEYSPSRIQSVSMFRGELEPKRHTIYSQKNNDMDVTKISKKHPQHAVIAETRELQKNRQTIMFQANNELDTTNIINNECLHPRIHSIKSDPKRDTIFNHKSNELDVINSSQEHPQHSVISETRDLQKNRQSIMFQANNELDTTNISDSDHLHSRITSCSKNRKESESKRNAIFNQENDMNVTNISIENPQHPVTVDSKRINQNRRTIMFQESNELDSTNITDNEYSPSRIQSVSLFRDELEPKRHTIYSQKNNDMDVTNISEEHPQHAVIAETRDLQKNRQTIMFQANNDLDTTNISDNDHLHSRITSGSKNRKESEPKRHTIFNQENNNMDVTNMSIEHLQHPVTVDSKRINQNRQTIMFQANNELDTTNITDNEYLPSRIQSVSMFRSELEPKRHTIFSQKNNHMDETNIPQEHPPHDNPDSRGIHKNRQTIMFQDNELDTRNINNTLWHPRIQSIVSEPKRDTIFNQKSNEMCVINNFQEDLQHAVIAKTKGLQKNRQTIMFQANNELDITNSSNIEYLNISRPHQKSQKLNKELDITNNRDDKIIQHSVCINENEKLRSENFLKRKTLFFDENIEIDGIPDIHTDSKSQLFSCFPNETQNLSIDKSSYTEVINTLRPRKFSQNQIQRIDKFIRTDLSNCEPSPKRKVPTLANISQDLVSGNINFKKSEQQGYATNRMSEEREQHAMTDMEKVELQVNKQSNLFQNNDIELEQLSQYHRENISINRNESEEKRNTTFFHKNNDMDVTNISHEYPQHTVIADILGRNQTNNRRTVLENNDLDITKIDEEQKMENKWKKDSSNKHKTIMFQENTELDTTNIINNEYMNRIKSEPKHHTIFNQINDDMNVRTNSKEQPFIGNIGGIQKNRQTIMFQENIELDTTNNIGNEYVTSRIQSVFMNHKESEPKRHTIVNQKNDDMDVTNITQEHSQPAVIADKRTIQKDRQTILQKSEPNRYTIFNQKNNDMDVTNIDDIGRIQKTCQTIMFKENNELNTTNTRMKTIVSQNIELDLTNNKEDITNKTVNRSINKNDVENLVSNRYLKRKMTIPDQINNLDLDDVPKKANNSFDNYDHKPDLVSNKNMKLSEDYSVDINYNNSNISIKLSTPVKNPNNTTISAEKTGPTQTVLSTKNNDLIIGDLKLNIGMKKMDNSTESYQNKSDIDFSIVYSPGRTSNFKTESNMRKESSENSIRKTINFNCDNELNIANTSTKDLPLTTMTPSDSMHLNEINPSTSEKARHTPITSEQSQEFTPNSTADLVNATSGKSCHTSTKSKQSQEYKPNCTGHLCRNADITKLTEEQKNVSKVFDKIRKSFGLCLSLDDDIENTRFNLADDSAITVNGSLTEYLNNEKYQIQMNQVPILNPSNDKKSTLEQSNCETCKYCRKNMNAYESTLHGFTLDDNSNDELKLDFSGYDKFQDIPTMQKTMDYYKKKRQELYDWYNSQIDAVKKQESVLLLKTPSLKLLDQNYGDELYKKAITETEPDVIEPIFPLKPSVEFLIKNKFKYEKLDWKINDLHLPAGILEVRHKLVRTFCLQFLFKKDNYAETTEDSINFDKVLFKECSFYENWTARDLFIHNELSLKIPTNLTPSCSSSLHLFTFLEYINKICKNVMLLTRELMLTLIDTHASLEKDESNQCFIRKLVRKNLSTYQEIFIRINDSTKLSHSNVGLRPGPLSFNDNIQSLPVGLQFVQQFLKEPSKFMKLF